MGDRERWLVAGIWILGLILAGCQPSPPGPAGTPRPETNGDATQAAQQTALIPVTGPTGEADPLTPVLNAMRAQLRTKGVRVHSVITSDGETVRNLIEFVPPESYHMVLNNGESEIILVDGKTYTKTGGSWVAASMNLGSMTSQLIGEQLIEEVGKTISDVEVVGPEVYNGDLVMIYRYRQMMTAGDQTVAHSVSKLWIRMGDSLPVKLESEIVSGSVISTLSNLYEYDPSIRITAPEP